MHYHRNAKTNVNQRAVMQKSLESARKLAKKNGREFTMRGAKPFGKKLKGEHLFEMACEILGVKHRKTKVKHPWTNDMAEKMVDIVKDHTVRLNRYKNSDEALADIKRFQIVHNFRRRLKALNFKSPYEVTVEWFVKEPDIFIFNPNELLTRL